jgi:hypothetical protein
LTTLALAAALAAGLPVLDAAAQAGPVAVVERDPSTFSSEELVDNGHRFFGSVSRGLALTVQEASRRWGEPNGYILGQEVSGVQVHDARLAAVMRVHGVTHILTFNPGDFARYGVTAVAPQDVPPAMSGQGARP